MLRATHKIHPKDPLSTTDFPAIPPGKTKLDMKTLTETELDVIDGGSVQPLDGPLPAYFPPMLRAPMHGIEGSLSVTPSYLNG